MIQAQSRAKIGGVEEFEGSEEKITVAGSAFKSAGREITWGGSKISFCGAVRTTVACSGAGAFWRFEQQAILPPQRQQP
jgi:hypothetical protein